VFIKKKEREPFGSPPVIDKPMKTNTSENKEAQQERLKHRSQDQQMLNEVIHGTGMSFWEAQVAIEAIHEIYFQEPGSGPLRSGQIRYTCVRSDQGAGKAMKQCQFISCALTLIATEDHEIKGGSQEIRRHKMMRVCEEAKEQGGLLTQEDLCSLLCCDVRTIRRDIRYLKEKCEIIVPTRGQQKDIGPTVSHKGIAIKHWLNGKEPQEVAWLIHHSLKAVERYIGHFARVIFLARQGFSKLQIAFTVGVSNATVNAYLELYEHYKGSEGFGHRVEELKAIGASHFESGDEKKGILFQKDEWKNSKKDGRNK